MTRTLNSSPIDDAETKFNDAQSARGSAVEALANAQGIADTKDIEFNTAAGELLAGQEALAAANEVRANETAVVNEIRDLLKELNYAALDEGETQTVTVIGDQSTAIIKDTTKGRGIYIAGTYTLEFRLKLTGTLDTWGNIILYGDDTENERAPAVFTVPGTTKLAFQHNSVEGGANTGVEPEDPLTVDTQYNIKMRVVEEDGSDEQNTMKVYYNNMAVPVGELTVQKFTFFAHKNFWVSDPDHDAALGEISNLKLTAGRPLSCTPSCVPETTANLATKKDRSFDTHPVFGPILLQIRHQHQHKHKVRPEAQRKIHAALDKLVGKLQDEQEKEETEVARLQSVNDQSNSQLVDSQGVLTTRNTELTDRESELAAARSYLAECRDTFNTDDPVRDEEIEVLDDVLAILDQFEGIANTDQSEYNNMRNYGDPTQLTDGVNAMGNTGLMYR